MTKEKPVVVVGRILSGLGKKDELKRSINSLFLKNGKTVITTDDFESTGTGAEFEDLLKEELQRLLPKHARNKHNPCFTIKHLTSGFSTFQACVLKDLSDGDYSIYFNVLARVYKSCVEVDAVVFKSDLSTIHIWEFKRIPFDSPTVYRDPPIQVPFKFYLTSQLAMQYSVLSKLFPDADIGAHAVTLNAHTRKAQIAKDGVVSKIVQFDFAVDVLEDISTHMQKEEVDFFVDKKRLGKLEYLDSFKSKVAISPQEISQSTYYKPLLNAGSGSGSLFGKNTLYPSKTKEGKTKSKKSNAGPKTKDGNKKGVAPKAKEAKKGRTKKKKGAILSGKGGVKKEKEKKEKKPGSDKEKKMKLKARRGAGIEKIKKTKLTLSERLRKKMETLEKRIETLEKKKKQKLL